MKKFKYLFLMLICLFTFSTLLACNEDNNDDPNKKPNDDPNQNGENNEDENLYDFMGQDFIIMVNDRTSIDPRSDNYQQLFREEKKALIEKVEKKYNVNIVYKDFPSDASWGGARERYIINNNSAGTPKAHVYEVPGYSIATLAVKKAISPLTNYIEQFGAKGRWSKSELYSTVFGEVYGYNDFYPLADEGIYYNIDMLEKYLGEGNGDLPSKLWLNGEWTWDKFKEIAIQLDELIASDEYVMGGMTYNWAYQMLGANGVHVVNTDLKSELATQAGIDTINYLNSLDKAVKWDYKTPSLSNATSTEMVKGKVAFHNGQSYWIFTQGKWLGKDFEIGFVPYPVGPNVEKDLSNYYINDVYSKAQHTISASYKKENIPESQQYMRFHDEIIFKIWSELQYFPEIDPETNEASIEDYVDEYDISRLSKYYGGLNGDNSNSVLAHRSIITKGYPDYFYSLDAAKAQEDGSYMLMIQAAVINEPDNIRSSMTTIASQIHSSFKELFNLPDDYYE